MDSVFIYLKRNILPVAGMIMVIVSTFTWAETRFEDLQESLNATKLAIVERIWQSELRHVDILDDSEELLIARMISTTKEVKDNITSTNQSITDLAFHLGVAYGIEISKEDHE